MFCYHPGISVVTFFRKNAERIVSPRCIEIKSLVVYIYSTDRIIKAIQVRVKIRHPSIIAGTQDHWIAGNTGITKHAYEHHVYFGFISGLVGQHIPQGFLDLNTFFGVSLKGVPYPGVYFHGFLKVALHVVNQVFYHAGYVAVPLWYRLTKLSRGKQYIICFFPGIAVVSRTGYSVDKKGHLLFEIIDVINVGFPADRFNISSYIAYVVKPPDGCFIDHIGIRQSGIGALIDMFCKFMHSLLQCEYFHSGGKYQLDLAV